MKHLITGGARSGKSTFALHEALRLAPEGPIGFIATAAALDGDMQDRIRRHQAERDARFITLEAQIELEDALSDPRPQVFIVDCLTLWCSNVLFSGFAGPGGHSLNPNPELPDTPDQPAFDVKVGELLALLAACDRPVLLVTNEVGLGIVPADPLSRTYRDWLGRLNQRVAQISDRVSFLVAGLPITVK